MLPKFYYSKRARSLAKLSHEKSWHEQETRDRQLEYFVNQLRAGGSLENQRIVTYFFESISTGDSVRQSLIGLDGTLFATVTHLRDDSSAPIEYEILKSGVALTDTASLPTGDNWLWTWINAPDGVPFDADINGVQGDYIQVNITDAGSGGSGLTVELVFDGPGDFTPPTPPPFAGHYLLSAQTGIGGAFVYMTDSTPTLGTNVTVTDFDIFFHLRVPDNNGIAYFYGLDEQANNVFWFYMSGGSFVFNWISNWSPFTNHQETVAVVDLTDWIWIRTYYSAGTVHIQYAPDSDDPTGTWVDLHSFTATIITRPAGLADGGPLYLGIQLSGAATPTTDLHIRHLYFVVNGSSPRDSVFETTATVVSNSITDDSGHTYTKHSSMVMSIGTA